MRVCVWVRVCVCVCTRVCLDLDRYFEVSSIAGFGFPTTHSPTIAEHLTMEERLHQSNQRYSPQKLNLPQPSLKANLTVVVYGKDLAGHVDMDHI